MNPGYYLIIIYDDDDDDDEDASGDDMMRSHLSHRVLAGDLGVHDPARREVKEEVHRRCRLRDAACVMGMSWLCHVSASH